MVQSEVGDREFSQFSPPQSSAFSSTKTLQTSGNQPRTSQMSQKWQSPFTLQTVLRQIDLGVLKFPFFLGRSEVFRPILNQNNIKHQSIPAIQGVLGFGAFGVLQEDELSPISCIKPWCHVWKKHQALSVISTFPGSISPLPARPAQKITPFTLERANKDDGCFLEFIFAVSINIPLIAHHSWRGAWWSQLLLTENIWHFFYFFSQACCTEGIIYIWIALSCDQEIYICLS